MSVGPAPHTGPPTSPAAHTWGGARVSPFYTRNSCAQLLRTQKPVEARGNRPKPLKLLFCSKFPSEEICERRGYVWAIIGTLTRGLETEDAEHRRQHGFRIPQKALWRLPDVPQGADQLLQTSTYTPGISIVHAWERNPQLNSTQRCWQHGGYDHNRTHLSRRERSHPVQQC